MTAIRAETWAGRSPQSRCGNRTDPDRGSPPTTLLDRQAIRLIEADTRSSADTSATLGRYIRDRRHATRLCVLPRLRRIPLRSRVHRVVAHRGHRPTTGSSRPFCPMSSTVWSRCPTRPQSLPPVMPAPSWAAGWGRGRAPTCGEPSALSLRWSPTGAGSVVTLLGREQRPLRRVDTYFCDEWVGAQGLDTAAPAETLAEFERSCRWG